MRVRRFLRTLLLRLAAWLDEAPVGVSPAAPGPPAHWLERVRRAQFVSSGDVPAPEAAVPRREVPRVGVPRVVARDPLPVARVQSPSTAAEPQAPRSAGFQPAAPPASSRQVLPPPTLKVAAQDAATPAGADADAPRREGSWPELPAGSRRSGRLEGGAPQGREQDARATAGGDAGGPQVQWNAAVPAAGRAASPPPVGAPPRVLSWPELPAGSRRSGRLEAGAPQGALLWPELPAHDDAILTLDDAEHLRRIEAEQRGSAWSE